MPGVTSLAIRLSKLVNAAIHTESRERVQMACHLQLVLMMRCVEVFSQACYTRCLQDRCQSSTAVTVMMPDSNGVSYIGGQQWYERKTAEFNALYPDISVSLANVAENDMVNEALSHLEKETNKYHAYIIPGLIMNGGISLFADRLMDMSPFTVENVNDISRQMIGRFFRTHASLYVKNVLSLPLSGDFVLLFYLQHVFRELGLTVPRSLEECTLTSQRSKGTDLNEPDYGSCLSDAGSTSEHILFAWTAQTLQYRGTSQGSLLDPLGEPRGAETLEASCWPPGDDPRSVG